METNNRVIRSLDRDTRRRVLKECDVVELKGRTPLQSIGETTHSVHFPQTAVISALASYEDGSSIEMANIGCEACTGTGLILDQPKQLVTTEVQIGGTALAMSADTFSALKDSLPKFHSALMATVQAVLYQVMVSGACNGVHTSRQRLARWLLTMADRNEGETMSLTQDFLSEMLSLRRATISEAASDLRDSGLIDYSRGRITITDRPGLHKASCECYDLVAAANERLLPTRD